ncbi:tRNA (adenosine(37)-N6)-dimethylallyltransferase MiaA [Nitratireductor kimnyeongensis]|uniref:tRNA dimethylallyltransferase n=1 Tax=Nitratireductor kimnyeongensis TaxID=430679 RepID=A0ABW0T9R7_9HYPH|nr:tRNA (adenosine(37)-N6)-dimethylallyltransferase MiaA [Nitratireductor kimnyeongensis]QZZ37267.1 tRNA (adenosine(37)-N6)-dimethylallyltransferase MiaA [Nitratireductor kimnyeongensis]
MLNDAILIAGPTASGKSALALRLALEVGGAIINADSMQVYDMLRVLSARPGADDLGRVPHHLYGHVSPSVAYSTGAWLDDVSRLLDTDVLKDRRPIFVGGTGLYFRALLDGIAPTPPVPEPVRIRWRKRLADEGPEALHSLLSERDAVAAAAIGSTDGQRITRALEVHDATGKALSAWQNETTEPLLSREDCTCIVLEPERSFVVDRIERRFDSMVADGALEEVAALLALDLAASLPAMKAIGVPELAAYLRSECTLEQAVTRAKTATRRYSKRQATWFRHQLDDRWLRLPMGRHTNSAEDLIALIKNNLK